ncbi:hypothetical protein L460_00489 [Klebsiella pneumoniae BIDMC 24]|nr:hypothetical protein L460_02873 [Klebsiella pneumoniae BIDMC 24]ESL56720.1 hypothetical protein L460_00489 [Klebsiella pneumoniae BIDMC 24]
MTTDITELAQREKFEAWARSQKLGLSYGDCGYVFSSTEMAWRAWMASSSELVEALEKAQQQMTESENRVRKQNRHICELFDDNTALRQRIAGLEARTVKLPDLRQIVSGDRYVWSDGVYNYSQDVKVALAAAGIKMEDE